MEKIIIEVIRVRILHIAIAEPKGIAVSSENNDNKAETIARRPFAAGTNASKAKGLKIARPLRIKKIEIWDCELFINYGGFILENVSTPYCVCNFHN